MGHKRIDEHTLNVLEFAQVLELLAGFASSDLGRDAARRLYPSTSSKWIRTRMAETSELRDLLDRQIRVPLAGLRDIRGLLKGFGKKKTVFEPEELFEISDTLAACRRLKAFLDELSDANYPALAAVGDMLEDYTRLIEAINRCISGDKTVRDDASEKLADIRKQIARLGNAIGREFRAIVSQPGLRSAIENDKFMMRHGRPVVAVKANYRTHLRGTVLDRSNTGSTLYIEPDQLVELSNELEDVLFEEKKEIGRILFELTHLVLDHRPAILDSLQTLSLIDLTYAKARFSVVYAMAAPQIHSGADLALRQARHPLLVQWTAEQKGGDIACANQDVVPIDVHLGDDFDLLLVTGPNTGGKTVMLKTVGLLMLMAQSGMHIPARSDSKVSVFRQVFADIGDEQSIQQSLSTFSAHMRQIVHILDKTDNRTLVLLDELGAGTDPVEGSVLSTAILDALLKRHGRIIATSHLGQLKTYAYTTMRAENASVRFDVETLQPTYQLMIGTPGSSNALAIASRLGMPDKVVHQAKELLDSGEDSGAELINQVQSIREDTERKRRKAQHVLDDAKQVRAKAKERLRRVRAEGERLQRRADKVIDESMQRIRRIVEEYARRMQNAPKTWREPADALCRDISTAADSTPLAERHAKFMEGVSKGDTVRVVSFRRDGIIDKVHRKRRTVVVLLAGKQIEVPFADVEPAEG